MSRAVMKPSSLSRIEILARSPGLAAEDVMFAVTVPTFRRPDHLLRTLGSLAGQNTTRRFAVVVMENDANARAGADAAAPLFERGEIDGLLVLAQERGNCSAYNAGWTAALEAFPRLRAILVIDDDEIADPGWIEAMVAAFEDGGADIVGGPQWPVCDGAEAGRWARHPVFAPPYDRSGPVPILYSSGNLLVSRRVLDAMPRPFLDPAFNFLGGGDSDFLQRCRDKGFSFGWCAEAKAFETVPARRLQPDWIRARSLRNGVISARVDMKKGRVRALVRSAGLLARAPFRAMARGFGARSTDAALHELRFGLGRMLAHFGYQNEQYRNADRN